MKKLERNEMKNLKGGNPLMEGCVMHCSYPAGGIIGSYSANVASCDEPEGGWHALNGGCMNYINFQGGIPELVNGEESCHCFGFGIA